VIDFEIRVSGVWLRLWLYGVAHKQLCALSVWLYLFSFSPAIGGDGAILKDNRTAYLSMLDESLLKIDLEDLTSQIISPEDLKAPYNFRVAEISKSGFILGFTATTAYAVDLEKQTSAVLYLDEGPSSSIQDLAYNPKTGALVLLLDQQEGDATGYPLVHISADLMAKRRVFCRRTKHISGINFDTAGNFYFCDMGDLWCGRIEQSSDDPHDVLIADRIAPLATYETYVGTSAGVGGVSVLAAGDYLYVWLERMGGSGWGEIVRMKRMPVQTTHGNVASTVEFARRSAKFLQSVEHIVDTGQIAWLVSNASGDLVLGIAGGGDGDSLKGFLVRNSGKPEHIVLKPVAEKPN